MVVTVPVHELRFEVWGGGKFQVRAALHARCNALCNSSAVVVRWFSLGGTYVPRALTMLQLFTQTVA